MPKVSEIADRIASEGLSVRLQIDGGVDLQNIAGAAQAGSDTFVAGSCVFNSADRAATISELRSIAQANSRA
jgi:ribulose-phosphate 3-epimerase